jgi:hypothetical protein
MRGCALCAVHCALCMPCSLPLATIQIEPTQHVYLQSFPNGSIHLLTILSLSNLIWRTSIWMIVQLSSRSIAFVVSRYPNLIPRDLSGPALTTIVPSVRVSPGGYP